jgi:hypothetical protein
MAPYLAPRVKGAAEFTDHEEGTMFPIDLTRADEIKELLEAVTTLANRANRLATNAEERQRVQDMVESVDGLAEWSVRESCPRIWTFNGSCPLLVIRVAEA